MDGILVVNKEKGYTSRDVVNIVSKHFNTKKVGHTGTLDPMAEGVLVLCIGKALKVSELLTNHDKVYIAGVTLGIKTDTLDIDGNILSTEVVNIEREKIIEVVNSFKGSYMQEVPIYSAVKVNGKKLYEYARSNTSVKLPKKEVNIYDIEVIDDIIYNDGLINFKIKCHVSKGTYIRSLIRDIGDKLGVLSVMNSLVRTKQGSFDINEAYKIDEIKNNKYQLLDIYLAFPKIPKIKVNDNVAFKVKNGVILDRFFDGDMAFILDKENNLLAIYKNINNKARVYKMF